MKFLIICFAFYIGITIIFFAVVAMMLSEKHNQKVEPAINFTPVPKETLERYGYPTGSITW